MESLQKSLTKEYLKKLSTLSLQMNRMASVQGAEGRRKSRGKGNSMEFSDFRAYIPGDDLRRVDWNGYARFDRLFLKLFVEEKQASVNLFLDCSLSMAQDAEKCLMSRLLAASLIYITLNHTDRVNLFPISGRVLGKRLNVQSKNRFFELATFLDQIPYEKNTRLCEAVSQAAREPLGQGISVIISDFFSEDGYQKAIKTLQYKKQDVILVQVLSAFEKNPPTDGFVRLVDSENGQHVDVEMTDSYIKEYMHAKNEYEKELREYCFRTGNKFVGISADMPILRCPIFAY